jgi:F0F1-type ATP synthase delta subunit
MYAREYAIALSEVLGKEEDRDAKKEEKYLENFLNILRSRGHISLLPKVVRELEALGEARESQTLLKVARESDQARYKEEIDAELSGLGKNRDDLRVEEDDTLVGGYALVTKDRLVDKTHKRYLLELYRKLTA